MLNFTTLQSLFLTKGSKSVVRLRVENSIKKAPKIALLKQKYI